MMSITRAIIVNITSNNNNNNISLLSFSCFTLNLQNFTFETELSSKLKLLGEQNERSRRGE